MPATHFWLLLLDCQDAVSHNLSSHHASVEAPMSDPLPILPHRSCAKFFRPQIFASSDATTSHHPSLLASPFFIFFLCGIEASEESRLHWIIQYGILKTMFMNLWWNDFSSLDLPTIMPSKCITYTFPYISCCIYPHFWALDVQQHVNLTQINPSLQSFRIWSTSAAGLQQRSNKWQDMDFCLQGDRFLLNPAEFCWLIASVSKLQSNKCINTALTKHIPSDILFVWILLATYASCCHSYHISATTAALTSHHVPPPAHTSWRQSPRTSPSIGRQ